MGLHFLINGNELEDYLQSEKLCLSDFFSQMGLLAESFLPQITALRSAENDDANAAHVHVVLLGLFLCNTTPITRVVTGVGVQGRVLVFPDLPWVGSRQHFIKKPEQQKFLFQAEEVLLERETSSLLA